MEEATLPAAVTVTVSYWFTVIDLEVLLFMFIRSIREGDFPLFVTLLENIVPWMLSLDHIHYAKWLPLFLEDLKKMSNESNPVLEEFNKWYFTVNKTDHPFSSMGVDQAHEQNKVVKVDGGAIDILENEIALLKWAVAGPIISDLLNQADQDLPNPQKPSKHHEDTDLCENNFRKDRNSFLGTLIWKPILRRRTHVSTKTLKACPR